MSSTPEKPKTLKRSSTMTKTAEAGDEFLQLVGHEKSEDFYENSNIETRGSKRTQQVLDDILTSKKYKPTELNEEESEKLISQLKMIFRLFDLNQDKCIERKELKSVFKNLGKKLTKQKLDKIMNEVDTDGNGWISEAEFLKYMIKRRKIKLAPLTPEERAHKEKLQKAKLKVLRAKEKAKHKRTKESKEREKKSSSSKIDRPQ